ncbi:MAG: hypothetical protein WAZ18_00330 [Alphaproteobacteria bacterium]
MIKLGNVTMDAERLKSVIQTFHDDQIEEMAYWFSSTLGFGLPEGHSNVKEALLSIIDEKRIHPELATALYAAFIGMRIEEQREKAPEKKHFRITRFGIVEKETSKTFRIVDDGRDNERS